MARVASGQIADRPFVRTFYTVAAKRFSGELALIAGADCFRVGWHRGLVVAAEAAAVDGTLAVRAAAMFGPNEGAFTLEDQTTIQPDPGEQPVDAREVVFLGLCEHYGYDRLHRELRVLGHHVVGVAPDVARGLMATPWVQGATKALLNKLTSRMWRVDELVADCPDIPAATTQAFVYTLLGTDALRFEEVHGAPADRPSARTASRRRPAVPTAAPVPVASPPSAPAAQSASQAAIAVPAQTGPGAELRAEVEARLKLVDEGADYFTLLGLPPTAPTAQVRTAYFELAKLLHPDRVRAMKLDDVGPSAQRVFAKLNEAFGVLSNEQKRTEYQEQLLAGPEGESADEAKMRAILDAEENFQLGEMALRRSQFAEAMEKFDLAVELNPEEAEHLALAAWARWCAHSDKESVARAVKRQLHKAVALSPNNPRSYYYRGLVAKQEGDMDGAIAAFEKVLKLNPEHSQAGLELRLLDKQVSRESQKQSVLDRFRRRKK